MKKHRDERMWRHVCLPCAQQATLSDCLLLRSTKLETALYFQRLSFTCRNKLQSRSRSDRSGLVAREFLRLIPLQRLDPKLLRAIYEGIAFAAESADSAVSFLHIALGIHPSHLWPESNFVPPFAC
jgi:hypothetical protein